MSWKNPDPVISVEDARRIIEEDERNNSSDINIPEKYSTVADPLLGISAADARKTLEEEMRSYQKQSESWFKNASDTIGGVLHTIIEKLLIIFALLLKMWRDRNEYLNSAYIRVEYVAREIGTRIWPDGLERHVPNLLSRTGIQVPEEYYRDNFRGASSRVQVFFQTLYPIVVLLVLGWLCIQTGKYLGTYYGSVIDTVTYTRPESLRIHHCWNYPWACQNEFENTADELRERAAAEEAEAEEKKKGVLSDESSSAFAPEGAIPGTIQLPAPGDNQPTTNASDDNPVALDYSHDIPWVGDGGPIKAKSMVTVKLERMANHSPSPPPTPPKNRHISPPPPFPSPPPGIEGVEVLFNDGMMELARGIPKRVDYCLKYKSWLKVFDTSKWWRWQWQGELVRRFCGTGTWAKHYGELYRDTTRHREKHTILGSKKSIFVKTPGGISDQMNGLVYATAVGTALERAAFLTWEFQDAFDNSKLLGTLHPDSVYTDPAIKNAPEVSALKIWEEVGAKGGERELHEVVRTDLANSMSPNSRKDTTPKNLCSLLAEDLEFRHTLEEKLSLSDPGTWGKTKRAISWRAVGGRTTAERERFLSSPLGELMARYKPPEVSKDDMGHSRSGSCALMESCILRSMLGRPSRALLTRVSSLREDFSRCDTVVVGLHVRIGSFHMAHLAEEHNREMHQELRRQADDLMHQAMKAEQQEQILSFEEKKRAEQARAKVEEVEEKERNTKFAYLDARMSKSSVRLMFRWAEVVGKRLAAQKRVTRIMYFIATDTPEVVNMARATFGWASVLVTDGEMQDTNLEMSAEAKMKAAADWWLLTQVDGLVMGRQSSFSDKALLAAMHIPVVIRCRMDTDWQDGKIGSNVTESGLNDSLAGWSCRPVEINDEVKGPTAS